MLAGGFPHPSINFLAVGTARGERGCEEANHDRKVLQFYARADTCGLSGPAFPDAWVATPLLYSPSPAKPHDYAGPPLRHFGATEET